MLIAKLAFFYDISDMERVKTDISDSINLNLLISILLSKRQFPHTFGEGIDAFVITFFLCGASGGRHQGRHD